MYWKLNIIGYEFRFHVITVQGTLNIASSDLLVPFTLRPMILLDPFDCGPAAGCGAGGALRPASSPGLSISTFSPAHINLTPGKNFTTNLKTFSSKIYYIFFLYIYSSVCFNRQFFFWLFLWQKCYSRRSCGMSKCLRAKTQRSAVTFAEWRARLDWRRHRRSPTAACSCIAPPSTPRDPSTWPHDCFPCPRMVHKKNTHNIIKHSELRFFL